jgi:ornithine carbamoyltransferase
MTNNQNALYMHCLPADISGVSCKQGEVSSKAFEHYRIKTYREAGFKPYIIAAMMFTNKFSDPAEVLRSLLDRNRKRVGF